MKNIMKNMLSRLLLICVTLLCAGLSGCMDDGQTLIFPMPASSETPPTNLLTQDSLIWVPEYKLPPGWHINLDNPEAARGNTGQGLPYELKVFYLGSVEQNSPLSSLRDRLYQEMYCQDQAPGSFTNCQRGFQKITREIDGFHAEILRYYGTWRDDQQEVNEIYLDHDGIIMRISSEGDFQEILPAIQSMLQTISWTREKQRSGPAQEPEELGL